MVGRSAWRNGAYRLDVGIHRSLARLVTRLCPQRGLPHGVEARCPGWSRPGHVHGIVAQGRLVGAGRLHHRMDLQHLGRGVLVPRLHAPTTGTDSRSLGMAGQRHVLLVPAHRLEVEPGRTASRQSRALLRRAAATDYLGRHRRARPAERHATHCHRRWCAGLVGDLTSASALRAVRSQRAGHAQHR